MKIRVDLDAARRNPAVFHAEWNGPDAGKRVQDKISRGKLEVIGDVVSELGRKAGCQPVPAVDRQVELSLKCDGLRATVGKASFIVGLFDRHGREELQIEDSMRWDAG